MTQKTREDLDKLRTPNLLCPACKAGFRHHKKEWEKFHPFAREGFNKEQGWTSKLKEEKSND